RRRQRRHRGGDPPVVRPAHRRRDPRAHERQPLPLRRLPEHRGGGAGSRREAAGVKPFAYTRAADIPAAVAAARDPRVRLPGGGTNLLDLMKMGVEQPEHLVDVTRLPLTGVDERGGGLRIGAMAKNSDVANHPLVRARYPLLSQALLAGASPQLRNMATMGGN